MFKWIIFATVLASDFEVQGYSIHSRLDQEIGPVIYANIAYRHGYRSPIGGLPGIPLSYSILYPQGDGELTRMGMLSQYELGRWFRRRYEHLIPSVGLFNSVLINVTSCSSDRTVASALCNLAGMFPPGHDNRWGPIDWMPVPLNTVSADRDNLFDLPNKSCKKWVQAFDAFKNSQEYEMFVGQYSWALNDSITIFNSTFNFTDPVVFCNGVFGNMAFATQDPSLPLTAVERKFFESIDECNMAFFHSFSYTDLMRRLVGGPLLKQMIHNMETALVNERNMYFSMLPFERFAMFSGKDLTLAPLLFTMGVNATKSPKPASAVLLELRLSSNGTAYVTALYKNSDLIESEPELLDLPLCPNPCQLDKFVNVMKPFIPGNWENECNS